MRRYWIFTVCFFALLGLNGCASLGYYWQAAKGHLSLLAQAKPVDEVLKNEQTSPRLKDQLAATQEIRRFASSALGLPDNSSYTRYVALDSKFPVWNVTAAPADSLDLQKWCFPLLGCISYKGFYDEMQARQFGQTYRELGFDVAVTGVPAYSTLGFTPDPLLSSFIYLPQGELSRLIFHELAHQQIYIADDTAFNESFATAVEELGVALWLAHSDRAALRAEYVQFDRRRSQFRELLEAARLDLLTIYGEKSPSDSEQKDSSSMQHLPKKPSADRVAVINAKSMRLAQLKAEYERLRDEQWQGWPGYDRYFYEDLNNAKLALGGLYTQYVPKFKLLFEACGSRFDAFYAAVKILGRRPKAERLAWFAEPQSISCMAN